MSRDSDDALPPPPPQYYADITGWDEDNQPVYRGDPDVSGADFTDWDEAVLAQELGTPLPPDNAFYGQIDPRHPPSSSDP